MKNLSLKKLHRYLIQLNHLHQNKFFFSYKMSTVTKQQLIEYIEAKIKDLDEYHEKIKQKLLSIDLKSFDTTDQELERYLNSYKAEGYALMRTKFDIIDETTSIPETVCIPKESAIITINLLKSNKSFIIYPHSIGSLGISFNKSLRLNVDINF